MQHKDYTKIGSLKNLNTGDQTAVVRGKQFQELIADFDVINPSDGQLVGDVTGDVTGEVSSVGSALTEHGAGAIGTAVAPKTYRWTEQGHIITEIHVDLTGLQAKGTAANDVIGLAAGGAAYIGRYVTATCGVVYRVEAICLETPASGGTGTTDVDIAGNSAADLAYDGAAGAAECNLGGVAVGNSYITDAPALTANDYLYLVEGDTAASEGEFNAGMLIIRLYGHAVLA